MHFGGEPRFMHGVWLVVYTLFFCISVAFGIFAVVKWAEFPFSIRVISLFLCCFLISEWAILMRCKVGADCFLLDHPLSVYVSGQRYIFKGMFSQCEISLADVKEVGYRWSWAIVRVYSHGKIRSLWLAPWFHNRNQVLALLVRQKP